MEVPFATVRHIHQDCKNELFEAFERVFEKDNFILGQECKAFEEEFSKYCGCESTIGCGNGMDSITIALKSYGIGPGDEVIVPAFTFIATSIAVVRTGAKPVMVDVEKDSTLIDVDKIESSITERTKAIVPVHLYGQPANMGAMKDIADTHELKLISDSAQAHGAKYNGTNIGSLGDASCFSFYPGKNLGALGDGGAITTNDRDAERKMRMLTNYGSEIKYHHEMIGFNSRLDELQSAFLRVKLKKLDDQILIRKSIAERYLNEIDNLKVDLPTVKYGDHVWHVFSIHVDNRDEFKNRLKEKGVNTNIHYPIPIHMQKAFDRYSIPEGKYPVTEKLAKTELSIPMYVGMTDEQITYVIDTINGVDI